METPVPLTRAHRKLIGALTAILIFCSLLGVHGFSTPVWHSYIDQSGPSEMLYGRYRDIRSDDWLIFIPLMFAQTKHHPKFPLINTNIGMGTNMLVPFNLPILHPSVLFKPGTWGFFFSNDTGLAWLFWSKMLGIFYGAFLVLFILTRNDFFLSFWGALVFVFSPYFQFWTFQNSEPMQHGCFAFVGIVGLLLASSSSSLFLFALLFGWQSVAFVVDNIYPPTQIVTGVFFLALLIGVLLTRKKELQLKSRLFPSLFAFLIIVVGLSLFFSDAMEAIKSISNTAYPGKRIVDGGGYPFLMLFGNNYLPRYFFGNFVEVGNFCEAANFFLLFPIVLISLFFTKKKKLIEYSTLSYILFGALTLFLVYTYVGLPRALSLITGLGKSTPNRTQMGIGFADLCLIVLFILNREKISLSEKQKRLIFAIWAAFACYMELHLLRKLSISHRSVFFIPLLLNLFFGWILLSEKLNRKLFLPLVAVGSFFYTLAFNPIVYKGSDYLLKNNLSTKIEEINSQTESGVWAVFGGDTRTVVLSNLLRMLGVRCINGYLPQPQMNIISSLGPAYKLQPMTNQSAFLMFVSSTKEEAEFITQPGTIKASISPLSKVFLDLKVSHFMFVNEDDNICKNDSHFEQVLTLPGIQIYRRKQNVSG